MKRLYITGLLGILCLALNAQDFKKDLEKVNAKYLDGAAKTYEMKYKSFKSVEDTEPEEVLDARYVMAGLRSYYFENSQMVMVKQTGKMLLVDKEDSNIYLQIDSTISGTPGIPQIDSMMTKCESIDFLSETPDSRKYKLSLKKGFSEFESIEVTMDTKGWYINQIRLFYNVPFPIWEGQHIVGYTKPIMEVTMQLVETSDSDINSLNLSSYITKANGIYKPAKNYVNYEVIGSL